MSKIAKQTKKAAPARKRVRKNNYTREELEKAVRAAVEREHSDANRVCREAYLDGRDEAYSDQASVARKSYAELAKDMNALVKILDGNIMSLRSELQRLGTKRDQTQMAAESYRVLASIEMHS